MKNIKKIFFLVLFLLINTQKINAGINDALFMTIGNKPITQSDIVDEIKIILILNNESYSDDKRDQLHELAVRSTVKRTIKKIELERNNFFQFNEEDLERELARLASNIFIDVNTLKNLCESNELDFSKIEDQVKTELYWNSLIFEMYKGNLKINQEEIEDQLKLSKNKNQINEYLISEIVISKVEDDKLDLEVQELKRKIENESFEQVAREVSISESALKGGDLGWINETQLNENLLSQIRSLNVKQLTKPIQVTNGYLIIKLNDKREKNIKIDFEKTLKKMILEEKNRQLNQFSLIYFNKIKQNIYISEK